MLHSMDGTIRKTINFTHYYNFSLLAFNWIHGLQFSILLAFLCLLFLIVAFRFLRFNLLLFFTLLIAIRLLLLI